MEKRKVLSAYLKCKVAESRASSAKICDLAKQFGVSERTIYRILERKNTKKKRRARPGVLTPHGRRKILAESRKNPTKSAKAIADSTGLSVSERTIQRVLKENTFVHVRKKKTDEISKVARDKRLVFAKVHLPKGEAYWHQVVFSDEKKWNLKGNDGFVSLWLEKNRKYTVDTDVKRRPGIMVWGAISKNGARYICRIKGKITSDSYVKMLEEVLLNDANEDLPVEWIFQQDNAPVHTARNSKQFFEDREIRVLEWPPYSPDLNVIENLWGIVSKKVYKNGKEYQSADELWESVSSAFLNIPDSVIEKLYKSIPERLITVIEKKGRRTRF